MLVVSYEKRKLQKFTTCGTLLQNIQLPSDAGIPWHAIDLLSGQFVASCREPLHSVQGGPKNWTIFGSM